MTSKGSATSELRNPGIILLGILVFGCIWAFSEVALGGGLRAADFPYRAALLTGIGMGITGIALAIYKKPAVAICIGLVAASMKLLAVPVAHLSVMCLANSCIAVALEALAVSVVAFGLMKAMEKNVYARIGTGGLGAFTGSGLFWLIGMHVAPCRYLLSFAGDPGRWMVTEGLIWAAFSAVLLPVGYLAGEKLQPKIAYMLATKPRLSYATAATLTACCCGAILVALMAGL